MGSTERFCRSVLKPGSKMAAHDGVGVKAARLMRVFSIQEPQLPQPVHGDGPAHAPLLAREAMKRICQAGDGGLGEQRVQRLFLYRPVEQADYVQDRGLRFTPHRCPAF